MTVTRSDIRITARLDHDDNPQRNHDNLQFISESSHADDAPPVHVHIDGEQVAALKRLRDLQAAAGKHIRDVQFADIDTVRKMANNGLIFSLSPVKAATYEYSVSAFGWFILSLVYASLEIQIDLPTTG